MKPIWGSILLSVALAAVPVVGLPLTAVAASIQATVNDKEILDTDIRGRAQLLQLEHRGNSASARNKAALDELIDEALMVQEAHRIGVDITEAQVDEAYTNVARSLRVSTSNLAKILNDNGVPIHTLRDRLRSGLAWQAVTQNAVAPRVQISEVELDEKAASELTETTNFDYILKEIRFIIPQGSKISASKRTAEANQYRQSYQGCDSAVDLSLSYTDAAVIDLGRRHATQLPDALSKELAALDVGGITKPRVVENGVSLLAICSKTSARDLNFIKNDLRQEVGTEKLQKEADDYLARLRERASISKR